MSISPNVPSPQESYHYESATGTPRWIAVLFIVLFLALVGLGYAGYSIQSRLDTTLSKAQDQNKLLTAELDQANARLADLKGHIDVTEQKMHMTQAELANARSRAESIRKDQVASDQKLAEQLNAAQRESNEKINAVATEVGGAKKDIESTRSDLEATKGRLERASGDMGVMSGLITLNKTDLKKSKYTVTVFVDDRSIEKKDKTAGEPVQFYVRGGSRMPPYEFIVFEVGKNQITGYLSTPKDAGAAPAATPAAAVSKPS